MEGSEREGLVLHLLCLVPAPRGAERTWFAWRGSLAVFCLHRLYLSSSDNNFIIIMKYSV